MDEQVQVSSDQPTPVPSNQPTLEQASPLKWLPFGLTWNVAWKWSTVVLPILCVLSFLGIAFGIYIAFSGAQIQPLIFAAWFLITVVLWLVVVVHTVVDVLVVREWENGNWEKAFNGYTGFLLIINGICLVFGVSCLAEPAAYGWSSFLLLVSLGTLTFMDIWVMNHMKERKALETTL